ncbi:hypothetical protein BaRGS_00023873 [Batillaria attramentaria]|uniref:Uncharacterized protein n=1 Tax=Batillaria attramentaria TaxID=370345 RepID=A0ABD0KCK6_9CAEN
MKCLHGDSISQNINTPYQAPLRTIKIPRRQNFTEHQNATISAASTNRNTPRRQNFIVHENSRLSTDWNNQATSDSRDTFDLCSHYVAFVEDLDNFSARIAFTAA